VGERGQKGVWEEGDRKGCGRKGTGEGCRKIRGDLDITLKDPDVTLEVLKVCYKRCAICTNLKVIPSALPCP